MKSASEFHRDSTRMYDLTKEYNELRFKLIDAEDEFIRSLPSGANPLWDNDLKLRAYLDKELASSIPEVVTRFREVGSELQAMFNEQSAIIAAGWAANFEMVQGGVRVN